MSCVDGVWSFVCLPFSDVMLLRFGGFAASPTKKIEALIPAKLLPNDRRHRESILARMLFRFPSQVSLAESRQDVKLAEEVFERTRLLPSEYTNRQLEIAGFVHDGPLYEGSDLTLCFKHLRPYVLKPLSDREARRIEALLQAVQTTAAPKSIVQCELFRHANKTFAMMPRLEYDLNRLPVLTEPQAVGLTDCVQEALAFLHARGFGHCDIKSGNVCVDQDLSFVLIDLGSVAPFGSKTSSTPAYVPSDVPHVSGAELDWCMLLLTVLEKACRVDVSHGTFTKQQMLALLSERLPSLFERFSAHVKP